MATPNPEPLPWTRLVPALADDAPYDAMRDIFDRCGFDAARVCERLGIPAVSNFKPIFKGRNHLLTPEQPLDVMILLLMDGEYVEKSALMRLLPEGAMETLEALRLAIPEPANPELVFSPFMVLPVGNLRLASDRIARPDRKPIALAPDAVYPAAMEQTSLFMGTLPETPCDALLDVGAGTGVAALYCARLATRVWAADIAPRSTHFAEFNRRLNGVANAEVLEGDLYAPVEGLTFDRIVSHPPYVPAPSNALVYRDGGDDGEQILRRIVEGLPRFLRPGGRFYTHVMAADCEAQSFEERIREWLGPHAPEFDLVLASRSLSAPKDLVAEGLANGLRPASEVLYWREVWARRKVVMLFLGSVVIRRRERAGEPVTTRVQKGESFTAGHLEWLLDWQEDAASPERLLNLKPALSPHAELGILHRVRDGRFTPDVFSMRCSRPFDSECVVRPWLVEVVSRCNGQTTWREHFENARRTGLIDPETSAEEFAAILPPFVQNGLLHLPERPMED